MEENLQAWKNLGAIIRLEVKRAVQGKVTLETRYYISDEKEDIVQLTSVHLSGDIGVLKTSYIGIWISHSKKTHAEPEPGMLHRIFLH